MRAKEAAWFVQQSNKWLLLAQGESKAVLAEMILAGGACLHTCILQMYNRMLQGEFATALSVGLTTAVFTMGDADDMSNYRGITITPALAELFAMLLQNSIAD